MSAPGVTALLILVHGECAAAVAALDWCDDVVVADPAGVAPAGTSAYSTVQTAIQAVRSRWVLVLTDAERLDAAGRDALLETLRTSEGLGGVAMPSAPDVFGTRFAGRRAAIRCVPSTGAVVGLDGTLGVCAARAPGRIVRLRQPVRASAPLEIGDAVAALEPESRALAGILRAAGTRAGIGRAMAAALCSMAAILTARAPDASPSHRWIGALCCGYRAVMTYARLWEIEYAAGERSR